MPEHPSLLSLRQDSLLFVIVLIVIAMHLLLLGIGAFWISTPSAPKPHSKVIVQTIQLKPFQSSTLQNRSPIPVAMPILPPIPTPPVPQPVEQSKSEDPPLSQSLNKETPLHSEISLQKEQMPIQIESKPQPKASSPKPHLQEVKKTTTQKSAPVKKPPDPPQKQTQNAKAKSKAAEETEKKRLKQQMEAEKKSEQERIEVAKRKHQEEIVAAQEIAQQKLAKAKETLAKMGETRDKVSASSSSGISLEAIPKELGSLQVDALPTRETGSAEEWKSKEMSYSDEIAYRLKMALKLPAYGAVKIELTLDRVGKVVKVNIVHSESNKNKTYLESKIPTLLFPSFGQRFQGKSENTFEITLQNEA